MLDLLPFMQRAYLAGVFVAIPCALLGVFLVLRRYSLIGEALAHISFLGLALSYLTKLPLTLFVTVAGAVGIHELRRRARIKGDAAVGIAYTTLFALGLLLIGLTNRIGVDLFSFLFGNILAITPMQVWSSLGLATLVALVVLLTRRQQTFLALDEETARTAGVRANLHNLLLFVLAAVTVVLASRVVGILLVAAFLIIPASTALRLAPNLRLALLASTMLAVLAVLLGITLAYYFDLPTSAAIVLVSASFFVLSLYRKR